MSVAALRALVLQRWPTLEWRHHGIGALQAYLVENREPEVRVHVWHPDLVREGIRENGDAHDHRFDMHSTVLAGNLFEVFYGVPTRDALGDWWLYNVEHARSAGPEKGFDGECAPASRERYHAVGVSRAHRAGETYEQLRGTFHATRPHCLAVTCVAMHQKRGTARILVPWGREPVHAFGAPAPAELQHDILYEAQRRLRSPYV